MNVYQTDSSLVITEDRPLGSGGRGSVYPVEFLSHPIAGLSEDELVLKIIEPRHRSEGRKGKVKLLERMGCAKEGEPSCGASSKGATSGGDAQRTDPDIIAWPLASAYDEDANWVGYLMRRVAGKSLDEVKADSTVPFSQKVRLARRMCAIVHRMHRHGVVVGDVSLTNFLYDRDSDALALIDLDSAQVADSRQGVVYPTSESRGKSPEMLQNPLGNAALTSRSDDYLAAAEAFRLLFDVHPLDEYRVGTSSEQTRLNNVRNRRFGFDHASSCCGVDAFGDELARLLRASFEGPYDKMPSAQEYAQLLGSLEKQKFEVCPRCGAWRLAGQPARASRPDAVHAGRSTSHSDTAGAAETAAGTGLFPRSAKAPSRRRSMGSLLLSPYTVGAAFAIGAFAFGFFDPAGIVDAAFESGSHFLASAGDQVGVAWDNVCAFVQEIPSSLGESAQAALAQAGEQAEGLLTDVGAQAETLLADARTQAEAILADVDAQVGECLAQAGANAQEFAGRLADKINELLAHVGIDV